MRNMSERFKESGRSLQLYIQNVEDLGYGSHDKDITSSEERRTKKRCRMASLQNIVSRMSLYY